jgi:hypothetical protein
MSARRVALGLAGGFAVLMPLALLVPRGNAPDKADAPRRRPRRSRPQLRRRRSPPRMSGRCSARRPKRRTPRCRATRLR